MNRITPSNPFFCSLDEEGISNADYLNKHREKMAEIQNLCSKINQFLEKFFLKKNLDDAMNNVDIEFNSFTELMNKFFAGYTFPHDKKNDYLSLSAEFSNLKKQLKMTSDFTKKHFELYELYKIEMNEEIYSDLPLFEKEFLPLEKKVIEEIRICFDSAKKFLFNFTSHLSGKKMEDEMAAIEEFRKLNNVYVINKDNNCTEALASPQAKTRQLILDNKKIIAFKTLLDFIYAYIKYHQLAFHPGVPIRLNIQDLSRWILILDKKRDERFPDEIKEVLTGVKTKIGCWIQTNNNELLNNFELGRADIFQRMKFSLCFHLFCKEYGFEIIDDFIEFPLPVSLTPSELPDTEIKVKEWVIEVKQYFSEKEGWNESIDSESYKAGAAHISALNVNIEDTALKKESIQLARSVLHHYYTKELKTH